MTVKVITREHDPHYDKIYEEASTLLKEDGFLIVYDTRENQIDELCRLPLYDSGWTLAVIYRTDSQHSVYAKRNGRILHYEYTCTGTFDIGTAIIEVLRPPVVFSI